jgi:hypothetical protein
MHVRHEAWYTPKEPHDSPLKEPMLSLRQRMSIPKNGIYCVFGCFPKYEWHSAAKKHSLPYHAGVTENDPAPSVNKSAHATLLPDYEHACCIKSIPRCMNPEVLCLRAPLYHLQGRRSCQLQGCWEPSCKTWQRNLSMYGYALTAEVAR